LGVKNMRVDCYVEGCVSDGVVRLAESNRTRANGLGFELTKAYRSILVASPQYKLVVMGYPNIFPTTQAQAISCGWLTRSERAAVVQLASDMDATLRLAAQNAGTVYVATVTA